MWTLIIFFVALNASGYIIAYLASPSVGVIVGNSETMPYNMTDISAKFNLATWDLSNWGMAGVGLAAAGLFAYFTKQYVAATLAGLFFVLSVFLNIFSWLMYGFPKMLNILLGGTGLVDASGNSIIAPIFEGVILIVFFFELAGILAQRDFTRSQG